MNNTSKIVILLVEDDEMMRIFFRDIFWIHGRNDKYDVVIASSIKEAEEKFLDQNFKPSVIFLDIMMPIVGENNNPHIQIERTFSFIKKIKNDNNLCKTKIIIYSGQKEDSIKDEALKLGVDDYLIKGDLMPKEIIEYIEKINECNN